MFRLDSVGGLKWQKSGERYIAHVTLGVVGHPLKYYSMNKRGDIVERTEYLDEQGLFGDTSLASIPHLPIVSAHPPNNLYAGNRAKTKVGQFTGEITRSDTELTAQAVIDDWWAVREIDQALRRGDSVLVSPSYDLLTLVDDSQGGWIQRRGAYDHVAAPLKPGVGRGGNAVRMRLDSLDHDPCDFLSVNTDLLGNDQKKSYWFFYETTRADSVDITPAHEDKTTMTTTLTPFTLNGEALQTDNDAIIQSASRADSVIADLRSQIAQKDERITQLSTDLGQTRAQLDDANKRADTALSPESLAKHVGAKLQLWTEVMPIIKKANPGFRADTADANGVIPLMWPEHQIKIAGVLAHRADAKDDLANFDPEKGEDLGYLRHLYQTTIKEFNARADTADSQTGNNNGADKQVSDIWNMIHAHRADAADNPGADGAGADTKRADSLQDAANTRAATVASNGQKSWAN